MANPGDSSAVFCATLVDEWLRAGLRHAVVSPGSRSTPLAVALAARPEITLHLFHDERSAGFAALGIGRATGSPAVLLCTSGTAAAHFVAPVHEAHLSRVPIIVCTADRPPELRDVAAPQTIDQTKLFGTAVRWFHDPGVPSDDARSSWRSLARRCVISSTGALPGPVHLNLPFREPLLGVAGELPAVQEASLPVIGLSVEAGSVASVARAVAGLTGVVIAGRGAVPEVLEFAAAAGWPVLADATSGLRNGDRGVIMAFDAILRSARFVQAHKPEIVIRVGDLPASKVTSQWVAGSGATVIQVNDHGAVVDPDHIVSTTLVGPVARSMSLLAGGAQACAPGWMDDWTKAEAAAQQAIARETAGVMSEIAVARAVTESCAAGSNLVISSSMPIRDVEWFGNSTADVSVHSNRGANGIDGVMSTAVGVALATGRRTVVHVGDVAFIHDTNALWGLMRRDADVAVVVTNNDGGSIFSFLPQAAQLDARTFELLYGTPHGVDIASLAAAHGIPYALATEPGSIRGLLGSPGTRIIEVRTERAVNVAEHDRMNAAVIAAVESATA